MSEKKPFLPEEYSTQAEWQQMWTYQRTPGSSASSRLLVPLTQWAFPNCATVVFLVVAASIHLSLNSPFLIHFDSQTWKASGIFLQTPTSFHKCLSLSWLMNFSDPPNPLNYSDLPFHSTSYIYVNSYIVNHPFPQNICCFPK